MKCPACKTHDQMVEVDLHSEGFSENIITCRICGAVWSVNHGLTEIIRDPQAHSFLETQGECVEGDDYCYAA